MLVPEVWCRLKREERKPDFLIKNGYLEPVHSDAGYTVYRVK